MTLLFIFLIFYEHCCTSILRMTDPSTFIKLPLELKCIHVWLFTSSLMIVPEYFSLFIPYQDPAHKRFFVVRHRTDNKPDHRDINKEPLM
jgi:hypothetical protein